MEEFQCMTCGINCQIEGEYPVFYAWCNVCHKLADGFDPVEYAVNKYSEENDTDYEFHLDKGNHEE